MAQGKLLRQLVRAGAKSADREFVRVAEKVIEEERANRHHLLANDLERILYGEVEPGRSGTSHRYKVPIDNERGLPLLEVREAVRDLGDIILTPRNRGAIVAIAEEQAREEVLGSWGLRPAGRILFCGPPRLRKDARL